MSITLRTLVTVLSLCALATGTAACKNKKYPQCKKDKDCKADQNEKCVDGSCQNCKTDAECADKGAANKCIEFRCQDPTKVTTGGGGGGEIGDPCTQQLDCTGGWACAEGKCAQCTDDVQCSPSTCNLSTGRCSNTGQCQTDDQCKMDEICDGGTCVFSGTDPGSGGGPCGVDAVYFGFDSDQVGDKQAADVEALAKCIAEQQKQVILEAHADNVGTEEYNIELTDRRGNSVKNLLIEKGAPAELLQVLAKGALEATGTTEAERAKDRRVQFVFP
jgi:peptidoglycan-associated lipoprotein